MFALEARGELPKGKAEEMAKKSDYKSLPEKVKAEEKKTKK